MKRGIYLVLACGLALTCVGCGGDEKATSNATGASEVTGEFTLVNLSVPNMT